jgi:hypothetical protein
VRCSAGGRAAADPRTVLEDHGHGRLGAGGTVVPPDEDPLDVGAVDLAGGHVLDLPRPRLGVGGGDLLGVAAVAFGLAQQLAGAELETSGG